MASHSLLLLSLLLLLLTLTLATATSVRQIGCPQRCRTNRKKQRRNCRRNGCRLNRCFTGVGENQPLIRGFNCRARLPQAPPPPSQVIPITPPPPGPILAPAPPGLVPPPGTSGSIVRCTVSGAPAIGVATSFAGTEGVLIFRTFGPEFAGERDREAGCLTDGRLGFSTEDLIQILSGCLPQDCTVFGDVCSCPTGTAFCFRVIVNNAFSRNCPAS